jgi:hypothetical protein
MVAYEYIYLHGTKLRQKIMYLFFINPYQRENT